MKTTPFFYIIRHIDTGKRYAGIKFARGCHPSDLLTKYLTSSKIVSKLLKENINSFIIDKIIEFENKEDLIEFEEFFLTEVDAIYSDHWFNQSTGKAINPDVVKQTCLEKYGVDNWMKTDSPNKPTGFAIGNTYGCFTRSKETKDKMSLSFKGRKYSDEHNRRVSESRKGTIATEETRKKMSDARRGVPRPKSFVDKMSKLMSGENNPMYGKLSPRKGVKDEQFICEHCGTAANKGNFNRWHGDRCRNKSTPSESKHNR